ncbi:MAG: DUF3419 family protein [Hyphomicrobiaceae bacterium]
MAIGSQGAKRAAADFLGLAVHRNRKLSRDGMLERLFTLVFSDLVYPQIWEDPRVDMHALAITPQSRIVTIASGGCNVLSYLVAKPEQIIAVDLNHAHIALNRLKITAARHLPNAASFQSLFASGAAPVNVALYDRFIAPHLDQTSRAYWEGRDKLGRRRITSFRRGFYRTGLLGTFIAAAHVAARLYGRDPRRILSARSRQEQIEIYERDLAPLFRRGMLRKILGNETSLYGLGIPPAQYKALLGDAAHMADVVECRLRKLACDFDLSDNYFAWQAFNRGYADGDDAPVPPYLERENFDAIKVRCDRIDVRHNSFTALLDSAPSQSFDRYVLLDAQDWMDDTSLAELWCQITRTARPGSRVIFRTAGVQSILPGRVPEEILTQWTYAEDLSRKLGGLDRSAIYGGFHLYILQA